MFTIFLLLKLPAAELPESPQDPVNQYALEDFELSIKTSQVLKLHSDEKMDDCLEKVNSTKSSESSGISSVASTDDEIQKDEESIEKGEECDINECIEQMDYEDISTQPAVDETSEISNSNDGEIRVEKIVDKKVEELNNNDDIEKMDVDIGLEQNPYATIHGYSCYSLKDDFKPDSDTDSALGSVASEEKNEDELLKKGFRPGVLVWAGYSPFDWYASIIPEERNQIGGNYLINF